MSCIIRCRQAEWFTLESDVRSTEQDGAHKRTAKLVPTMTTSVVRVDTGVRGMSIVSFEITEYRDYNTKNYAVGVAALWEIRGKPKTAIIS
jgi:hypothetical protein